VLENRVLRRMSGLMRNEYVGNDQVMEDEMDRAYSMHREEEKNAYSVLGGKPE
jgi:hypothetical protein